LYTSQGIGLGALPDEWNDDWLTFTPLSTSYLRTITGAQKQTIEENREIVLSAWIMVRDWLYAPYDFTVAGVQAKLDDWSRFMAQLEEMLASGALQAAFLHMYDDVAVVIASMNRAKVTLQRELQVAKSRGWLGEDVAVSSSILEGFSFDKLFSPPLVYFVAGGVALLVLGKK